MECMVQTNWDFPNAGSPKWLLSSNVHSWAADNKLQPICVRMTCNAVWRICRDANVPGRCCRRRFCLDTFRAILVELSTSFVVLLLCVVTCTRRSCRSSPWRTATLRHRRRNTGGTVGMRRSKRSPNLLLIRQRKLRCLCVRACVTHYGPCFIAAWLGLYTLHVRRQKGFKRVDGPPIILTLRFWPPKISG